MDLAPARPSTPVAPAASPEGRERPLPDDAPVVLVVEDDVEVSAQLCDILRFRGIDPRPAYQGPEAVQLFLQCRPQVVVLDLMLPYMNGVQVLERIRRLPGGDRVPVLVVSAIYRESQVFERDFQRLGIREFLAKPFSLFMLADRVEAALDRRAPAATVAAGPAEDSISDTSPLSWPPRNSPLVVGGGAEVIPEIDAQTDVDRPMERVELLRFLAALCRQGASGALVLESGRDDRIELTLREGAVRRVAGDGPPESWERLRVLAAADREAAAERILGRVLDGVSNRVQFRPGTMAETAADLRLVDLQRSLYEATFRAFEFNAVADEVARRVGRAPSPRPGFEAAFARLRLAPPLDGLPALMRQRMPVEVLYNRMGSDSASLVRLLWMLEQAGLIEYVRP